MPARPATRLDLLARVRSSSDERQVIVSLTAHGRALKDRARAVPRCMAAALECSPDQIGALRKRLVDLRATLMKNAA